jgi:hypothetical protein
MLSGPVYIRMQATIINNKHSLVPLLSFSLRDLLCITLEIRQKAIPFSLENSDRQTSAHLHYEVLQTYVSAA